jgi:hypothetical protein
MRGVDRRALDRRAGTRVRSRARTSTRARDRKSLLHGRKALLLSFHAISSSELRNWRVQLRE